MSLLVDTDAFCKLASCGLFEDAVQSLGLQLDQCHRLPALTHMLRKTLGKRYGSLTASHLLPLAERLTVRPDPPIEVLDVLVPIPDIDPGEASLLAVAWSREALVLTSDKRALRALCQAGVSVAPLGGKVVLLEAAVLQLCMTLGPEAVKEKLSNGIHQDQMLTVVQHAADPQQVLQGYLGTARQELPQLQLWAPQAQ